MSAVLSVTVDTKAHQNPPNEEGFPDVRLTRLGGAQIPSKPRCQDQLHSSHRMVLKSSVSKILDITCCPSGDLCQLRRRRNQCSDSVLVLLGIATMAEHIVEDSEPNMLTTAVALSRASVT